MRDFRQHFASEPFLDPQHQALIDQGKVPGDVILQNREELFAFCEWIEANHIRSYLEIGIWTGRLLYALNRLFQFEKIAICDDAYAGLCGLPMHLPDGAIPFWGSSHSPYFPSWRKRLGHMDVVFIDGDHSYEGVKQDFLVNVQFPHRFLVFHDIVGVGDLSEGVARFWQELPGHKLEIVRPHNPDLGDSYKGMGIGIWWK